MARFDFRTLDTERLVRLEIVLHRAVEDTVLAANARTVSSKFRVPCDF